MSPVFFAAALLASAPGTQPWVIGTAFVLPAGRTEVGLFEPLRYGWSDRLEISAHPLAELLMPNVALKYRWAFARDLVVSTRHALTYPTGLFTAVSRNGTGGILPSETRVPHIIGLDNQLLASLPLGSQIVTGKLAVMVAGRVGEMNMQSIDLPVIYARTAAYRRGWSMNAGLDLDGMLTERFGYSVDIDAFWLSTKLGRWAIEHSGMIVFQATPGVQLKLGYKVVYGEYPMGVRLNLGDSLVPLPLFDIVWSSD